MNELTPVRPPTLSVRLTTKATNDILASLVDRAGSIKNAAKLIGVNDSLFGSWLSFRSCPSVTRFMRKPDKFSEIVIALERETGRSIYEIFPDLPKGAKAILAKPRTVRNEITTVRMTAAIEHAKASYTVELLGSGCLGMDARDNIEATLKTLSERERRIVELRYGFNDSGTFHTLEEVAGIMGVTRERIRQIEAKAIRNLQQPSRSEKLVGHVPDATPDMTHADEMFKARQKMTLAELIGVKKPDSP